LIPLYFETKPNGVPLLSNRDIELNAVAILKDFSPDLLTNPGPVDIERFIESYLGLNLDFNWLSNNRSLLGAMVFHNTILPVYDPSTEHAKDFPVKANTIIIDNSLVDIEVLLRSTMAHECGHAIYHRSFYSQKSAVQAAACTAGDIRIQNKEHRLTTDNDWLEHHARYFSAAILLPYPVIRIVCREHSEHLNLSYRDEPKLFNHLMAHQIATVFKVSVAAAKIRLRQLHLDLQIQPKPSPPVFPQDRNALTLANMTEIDLARLVEERDNRLFEQYYG
jgi:hypothetical protein